MEGPPPSATRGITRLASSTVSKIRSAYIVRGLAQCVEELCCNALDAGAASISIFVDVAGFSVAVEDDGVGISPADMKLLGQRYSTSKLSSVQELEAGPKTLGFRGEALASLAGEERLWLNPLAYLVGRALTKNSAFFSVHAFLQTSPSSKSPHGAKGSLIRTTR